jgi:hypothetical protein
MYRQKQLRLSLLTVLISLEFFGTFKMCLSDSGAAALPSTVVQQPSAPVLSGKNSADIGIVDALVQADASHTFVLSNPTASPLTLTALHGSCGCEHLAYLVDNNELQSTVVAPGKSVQVEVNVRLRGQPAAELSKTAWVIGTGGKILDTLTLSFNVRQPYKVEPQHLDIGDVVAGSSKTAQVTVQMDSSLLPNGTFPSFVSDTPGISAKQAGTALKTKRDSKASLAGNFIVTVDHVTNLGPFAAMLSFAVNTPQKTVETVYLPVSGSVVGDFTTMPRAINFGYMAPGADSERDLILSGSTSDKLKAISVLSGSKWITASIIQSSSTSNSNNSCTVKVILSGKAPAGPIKTEILLFSSKVQSIKIPVSATIVSQ